MWLAWESYQALLFIIAIISISFEGSDFFRLSAEEAVVLGGISYWQNDDDVVWQNCIGLHLSMGPVSLDHFKYFEFIQYYLLKMLGF